MNKSLSVVIPVYNVENYLREFFDSVVNQTYNNLQIILVDDGSTDRSGQICDEYAQKDSRITVVHQENQGAGAAKNSGLKLVKGEYLSIIDSDDYIDLSMYETMISCMEKTGVDVVQCRFRNVFKDVSVEIDYNFSKNNRIIKTDRFLFELLYDWKYAIFCNKVFKTSLLNHIEFPVGRKIDDEFFTYKLIGNAKTVLNINDCFYNYRMRKSSVMNSNKDVLIMDRIECFLERIKYIQNKFPKLYNYYYDVLAEYIFNNLNDKRLTEKENVALLSKLSEEYPLKERGTIFKIIKHFKLLNCNNKNMSIIGELFI